MSNIKSTGFPDKEYLKNLINYLDGKVQGWQDDTTRLLMLSGASMNWLGDFFTDEAIQWSKETIKIDSLVLTGMTSELNKIIIDQAQRSPLKLKSLMEDPNILKLFVDFVFSNQPILIREDEQKLKVLDGMHRVIAALRDGMETIEAYVARFSQKPQPQCEPHVIYDLLRAYHRKLNNDREGLISALKYLVRSYSNVTDLLTQRFGPIWIPDQEIQEIIKESLKE